MWKLHVRNVIKRSSSTKISSLVFIYKNILRVIIIRFQMQFFINRWFTQAEIVGNKVHTPFYLITDETDLKKVKLMKSLGILKG